MRPPPSLKRLIRRFLMMEIGAVALYRTHAKLVKSPLREMFYEFESIEIKHRERFADLDRSFHNGRGWWARPFVDFCAMLLSRAVGCFGAEAILRFERDVERKAIADYTDALCVVEHAGVRTALKAILDDETRHDDLLRLLEEYRADEEHHIHELDRALNKLHR